jgi:hypothetical protein
MSRTSRPSRQPRATPRREYDILASLGGNRRNMERKKASDYPQELLDLFDRYVHGELDRRGFLDSAK